MKSTEEIENDRMMREIRRWDRARLTTYLESWGVAVYDSDDILEVRQLAQDNAVNERDLNLGPITGVDV